MFSLQILAEMLCNQLHFCENFMATIRSTLKHSWESFKGRTISKADRFALKLPFCENTLYLTPYSRAFHACGVEYASGRAQKYNPVFEKYVQYAEARAVRWLKKGQTLMVLYLLEEACTIAAKFDHSLEANYQSLHRELDKPKHKRLGINEIIKGYFPNYHKSAFYQKAVLLPNKNNLQVSSEEG